MKKQELIVISRRKLVSGLACSGGLLLAGCTSRELPPTYGNVLRMGDLLTYRAFRTLLPPHALEAASRKGYDVRPGARGFVFNAGIEAIADFFDIGTLPAIAADR